MRKLIFSRGRVPSFLITNLQAPSFCSARFPEVLCNNPVSLASFTHSRSCPREVLSRAIAVQFRPQCLIGAHGTCWERTLESKRSPQRGAHRSLPRLIYGAPLKSTGSEPIRASLLGSRMTWESDPSFLCLYVLICKMGVTVDGRV